MLYSGESKPRKGITPVGRSLIFFNLHKKLQKQYYIFRLVLEVIALGKSIIEEKLIIETQIASIMIELHSFTYKQIIQATQTIKCSDKMRLSIIDKILDSDFVEKTFEEFRVKQKKSQSKD